MFIGKIIELSYSEKTIVLLVLMVCGYCSIMATSIACYCWQSLLLCDADPHGRAYPLGLRAIYALTPIAKFPKKVAKMFHRFGSIGHFVILVAYIPLILAIVLTISAIERKGEEVRE